jgi:hypothetical protein
VGAVEVTDLRIGLCAEDQAGADNVIAVFDRVAAESFGPTAVWVGEDGKNYRKSRRAAPGTNKFGQGPRERSSWRTRPALKVAGNAWLAARDDSDLVIVATDIDRKKERELSLEERLTLAAYVPPLLVAAMNPEAEAWRIVLVNAPDELNAVKRDLKFDPTQEPEKMSSTTGGPRDCKTIAIRLFGNTSEARMVFDHHPDVLKATPTSCGLPQFVNDLESFLSRR